jgi:hypothetical protein
MWRGFERDFGIILPEIGSRLGESSSIEIKGPTEAVRGSCSPTLRQKKAKDGAPIFMVWKGLKNSGKGGPPAAAPSPS